MSPEDAVKSGNVFVFRAFLTLVLIHYLILPKLPDNQRALNQKVGDDLKRLKAQRSILLDSLSGLNRQCSTIADELDYTLQHLPRAASIVTLDSERFQSIHSVSDPDERCAMRLSQFMNKQQVLDALSVSKPPLKSQGPTQFPSTRRNKPRRKLPVDDFTKLYAKLVELDAKSREFKAKRAHGRLGPKEKRQLFRNRPVWSDVNMVLNHRTGVVHWPHPMLFKCRYRASASIISLPSDRVEIQD